MESEIFNDFALLLVCVEYRDFSEGALANWDMCFEPNGNSGSVPVTVMTQEERGVFGGKAGSDASLSPEDTLPTFLRDKDIRASLERGMAPQSDTFTVIFDAGAIVGVTWAYGSS